MAENLRKYYEFKIIIGDACITTGAGATFQQAIITESIENLYSICNIIFEGSESFISDAAIVDGTPIKIFLKSKELNFSYVYYYRVGKVVVNQSTNNSYKYNIIGYTDFYHLFEPATDFAIKTRSSEIFRNIANIYNLESEIDTTNDEQLWICSEQNLKEYLSFVASRGWIDETSGMFWCIDRHRCLIYKDINTLFNQPTRYTFAPGTSSGTLDSKTMYYITSVVDSRTMEENIQNNGYGGSDFYFDLLNYELKETAAKKVKAYSNIININKEVSQGLKQSYYPFNIGNVHEHYYEAHDQNMRVLSTFSTYYLLTCQFFQPVRIGQMANVVKNSLSGGNVSKSLNIKSMIHDLQITFVEENVNMTVGLCTQGFNGTSTTTY